MTETAFHLPLISTFRLLDKTFTQCLAREAYTRQSRSYQVMTGVTFGVVLCLTPLTILADIVFGFAKVFFHQYRGELTPERFFAIAERNFATYPLEQMVFFAFGSFFFCKTADATIAYLMAQKGTSFFSALINDTPPHIFNNLYVPFQRYRTFIPGIVLNEDEEQKVKMFMTMACWFKYHHMLIKKSPPRCEDVQGLIDRVTRAETAAEVLDLVGIKSDHGIEEAFESLRRAFKQAESSYNPSSGARLSSLEATSYSEESRDNLVKLADHAKTALKAYFALPAVVRNLNR